MSKIIDKRKRSREDDVQCESTPLSKRINNLHLTNFEEAHHGLLEKGETTKLHPDNKTLLQEPTVQIHNKVMNRENPGGSSSAICGGHEVHMYNPELSESQNPFYYVKNKLLHDLHLERLKRCTV